MTGAENIVRYGEIGEVIYVHNRKARNLTVRINREGKVRVTVPGLTGRKKAEAFLLSKKEWIIRKQDEIRSSQDVQRLPEVNDTVSIRGKTRRIELKGNEKDAEQALWRMALKEAREYLPSRLEELAREFGYSYSGLKIRSMKSRWGSCTPGNSINLNCWLVMLPSRLSDYVMLHELVHTRHKNHGAAFWNELDRITEGASSILRKELRKRPIMTVSVDSEDVLHGEANGTVGPV